MAAPATMTDPSPRPLKRSLRLSGHATSVTLEAPFWDQLRRIAARDGLTLDTLASRVDAARDPAVSLSSALRVFVLRRALARE